MDQARSDFALRWTVDTRYRKRIIWRNGRSGAYRAFIRFAPGGNIGIIALVTTNYGNFGVDDIGLHVLNAGYPLTSAVGSANNMVPGGREITKTQSMEFA